MVNLFAYFFYIIILNLNNFGKLDEVNLDTESKNKTKKDSSRQLNIYNYLKPRNSVLNKFAINQNPIYENIYDTIPNNNVKASEVNKEFIKLEPLKPN